MVAKKLRVVIVGAGVAGLAVAQRLCGAAGDRFDVTVVEASARGRAGAHVRVRRSPRRDGRHVGPGHHREPRVRARR
jgi:uncharacterized protein with NAD-binding domain and iron-sulfur cluster